jgi:CTP synthase (UTP-ammonia lyase)
VVLVPRTLAARLYGTTEAVEDYYCNYGVNHEYRLRFEAHGLRVSGVGGEGEIRIVEIADHPFFLATLFLPQARPRDGGLHPLLVGFAGAAAARRHRATNSGGGGESRAVPAAGR